MDVNLLFHRRLFILHHVPWCFC